MKKIIALALSILLGSTGYVIVDHTIEERVEVLESQVESLNGVVSSLEDKHKPIFIPTLPSYPLFQDGESIPVSDSQSYSFEMIHYTAYNFFDGIKGNKFTVVRGKDNTGGYGYDYTDVENINDFELKLTNVSFVCIAENNVSTTCSPDGKRTTKPYGERIGVIANCNGIVPIEYAGKIIQFSVVEKGKSTLSEPSYYSSVINSDGAFSFEGNFYITVDVESLELIDPVIIM